MKQPIAISVLEFDGQYDVEVYTWINAINKKGVRIEDITEYGFADQDEAIDYIQALKDTYAIVKLEQLSEDALEGQEHNAMTEEEFWDLIEHSLEQKDLKAQREWLIAILAQMSDEKINSFERILMDIKSDVYYHDQRRNAYRLAGVNGGDDSVGDFCVWLISRGKDVMEDVLENPLEVNYYLNDKNLNEYGEATNELFGYAADYAFRLKQSTQPK